MPDTIPNLAMGAKESGAHRDIWSRLRLASTRISLPLRRWYCNSALRLLISEIHALGRRSRLALEIREVELHRGKESVRAWMDECLVGEPCRRGYIPYMQRIEAQNYLTIVDMMLVTHAWKSGWESRDHAHKSQNQVDTSRPA